MVLPIVAIACRDASSSVPPSVLVTPLRINTFVREVPGVVRSARYFSAALEGALAADSSIQWLPRVVNTQPHSTPGNPQRPQYVIAGVLSTTTGDTLVLAWRITSLETAEVVAGGRMSLIAGREPAVAAELARLIAGTLRDKWDSKQ